MDWDAVIERNHAALKRILAALVAMAGLPVLRACGDPGGATAPASRGLARLPPIPPYKGEADFAAFVPAPPVDDRGANGDAGVPSPLWGGVRGGGSALTDTPTRRSDDRRPPLEREVEAAPPAPTLPRHLHRAVCKLLQPAEAAARRLVIVAARGIVVTLPPPRPRKAKPPSRSLASIFIRPGEKRNGVILPRGVKPSDILPELARPAPTRIALPLTDPRRQYRPWRGIRRRGSGPRIRSFDEPFVPSPPPPSPDDPVDARRLVLRFEALGRVLDDLPREAMRFARWRARARAAVAREKARNAIGPHRPQPDGVTAPNRKPGWFPRSWPLQPGRPPGWRRKPTHEVHQVLKDLHHFADFALEHPDTS